MRILLLAPQPFFVERGTPIATRLLAASLVQAGHQVDLVTYADGEDVLMPGVTHIRCSSWTSGVGIGFSLKKIFADLFLAAKALQLTWKNRYDTIHAVEEAVFIALFLAPIIRAKVVYDMDSSLADQVVEKMSWLRPIHPILNAFERFAVRRADLVLPVCRALADKIRDPAGLEKVHLLEDIALPAEPGDSTAEDLRSTHSIDGPLLLYVGNLEKYQGIDLLLEALEQVPTTTTFTAVIIGGSDKDIEHYRSITSSKGLSNRCLFIGRRPVASLTHYLSQADILLSPRIKGKNTPMKVYSYLASGKPLLATRIGSHTQVLDDTRACLVDPTPESMAAGINALTENPELREKIGKEGQHYCQENHSKEAFDQKLTNAYSTLSANA